MNHAVLEVVWQIPSAPCRLFGIDVRASCCTERSAATNHLVLNAVSAFRRVDEDWCTGAQSDESGTTATLGVIQGQRLTIAHVGDTRALIVRKDGSCAFLACVYCGFYV